MIHDELIKHGGYHPNYSEEMDYFEKGKIYSIQIEANLACDQGCLYCYASSENPSTYELPKKDIIKILNSAASMSVKAIDWLGGDPLLRKDWDELMKYSNKKGLINNIWTSGIPLKDKKIARRLVKLTEGGFISVHLDTLDESLYKKLHTGDPKTQIKNILQGVDNAQNFGKNPVSMINCITFSKLLFKDVEKTIKFFFEKKGMRTCLTQMCMTGLAKDHPEWIPNKDEIRHACNIRDQINYTDSKLSISTMDASKYYCGAMICITFDGDVTPCSVIRKGFGNINEQSLEKIIEENRKDLLFLKLREKKNLPESCFSCENNSICWGCRAMAFYESGDIYGIDPKCCKK